MSLYDCSRYLSLFRCFHIMMLAVSKSEFQDYTNPMKGKRHFSDDVFRRMYCIDVCNMCARYYVSVESKSIVREEMTIFSS